MSGILDYKTIIFTGKDYDGNEILEIIENIYVYNQDGHSKELVINDTYHTSEMKEWRIYEE
jgi:hypothetical protein